MSIAVTCDEQNLIVQAHYADRDRCKALPGARWDKAQRCWRYPKTAATARAIAEMFVGGVWTSEAGTLLGQADRIEQAAQHRTAADLPEIPSTKTRPWHHQKQAFWFVVNMVGGLPCDERP